MCADLEVGSLATEMCWLLKCIGHPQNTCTCEHVDPIFKAIFFVVFGRSIPVVPILTNPHEAGNVSKK